MHSLYEYNAVLGWGHGTQKYKPELKQTRP